MKKGKPNKPLDQKKKERKETFANKREYWKGVEPKKGQPQRAN